MRFSNDIDIMITLNKNKMYCVYITEFCSYLCLTQLNCSVSVLANETKGMFWRRDPIPIKEEIRYHACLTLNWS